MELLQLKYFLDTSKNENFARTAEKYFVHPSSVSASIKRLEKELGCTLFDRKANSIFLNENGKRFQKSIHHIFEELNEATFELSAEEKDDTEIRIFARSARHYIMDRIIEFNKKFPTVRFDTSFDFSENNYDDYDIVVGDESESYDNFERFELYSCRVGIKAAADSPLCGRPLKLSQLRNQNFVSMGENSNLHKILIKACNKAGFTPNVVVKTNDNTCFGKCIAAGVGLAVTRQAAWANPNPKIAFLDVTDLNERQTIYLHYKKSPKGKNVENFINFLKNSRT